MDARVTVKTPEQTVAFIEFCDKYDIEYAFDTAMPPVAGASRQTKPRGQGKFQCPDLLLIALFESKPNPLHRSTLGSVLDRGGFSAKTLPNTLAGLINGGRVETDGDGNYSLTPEGDKVAKQLAHLKETNK